MTGFLQLWAKSTGAVSATPVLVLVAARRTVMATAVDVKRNVPLAQVRQRLAAKLIR
jgi:hypothetical protein